MVKFGPKRRIRLASERVSREIGGIASRESRLAGALASEGYAGGYRDALSDVLLVLNGCIPDRRGYWIVSEKETIES